MRANKCDRCKKYYGEFDGTNMQFKPFSNKNIDLCNECSEKLLAFMLKGNDIEENGQVVNKE